MKDALPLDNLDGNFRTCDALIQPDGSRTVWPKSDVIIGNPPFLGAKLLKPERTAPYVKSLRLAYPDVPGMADYCVYWFKRSNDELSDCTSDDPFAGRAGLVGTQNVRNNASRIGGLDKIVESGTIVEAVQNQPWSGEAKVHVSIVNWAKTKDAALVPAKKRLWRIAQNTDRTNRTTRKEKQSDLTFTAGSFINSSLSDATDVSKARVITCNAVPQKSFVGIMTGHIGFVLTPSQASEMISKDPSSKEVIFPFRLFVRKGVAAADSGDFVEDKMK